MKRWMGVLVAVLCTAASADAQGALGPHFGTPKEPDLYAATTNGSGTGGILEVRGGPPWLVEPLAATNGAEVLRVFGKHVFVLDAFGSTITRVRRDGKGSPTVFDLGPNSQPQDIQVVAPTRAYVTRRFDSVLARLDPSTGDVAPVVDLGIFAKPNEETTLRMMQRDGNRLFVQVGFAAPSTGASRGVLAVLDLATEQLIDVDPTTPRIDAIVLAGAPPRARMQVLQENRTLYVSSTDSLLDNRGGIEMVDLDALESTGFALTEEQFGADIGGFVMTSPRGGYFLFHTDIVASTHLKPFSVAHGVEPGPEMIVLLGEALESLAYDPVRQRIYLPSGFAFFPDTGIYAFDTTTNEPIGSTIVTGLPPRDIELVD